MFEASFAETAGLAEAETLVPQRSELRAPADRTARANAQCSTCMFRHLCMASNLDSADLARLDDVVYNWRTVRQGQALYRAGDPFQSIYAVRSGSFKTVMSHESGREYISGFFLPGETVGLDGISGESHAYDAIALEDSAVCVIPFHLLEALCREIKSLQQRVHRILSAEIVRETGQMMLLGNLSAEQRVAAFLLNISSRLRSRGYSATEFTLRMTREDIGSYLGMTLETVSRTLSRFQQEGMIRVQIKQITLLDPKALAAR